MRIDRKRAADFSAAPFTPGPCAPSSQPQLEQLLELALDEPMGNTNAAG